MKRLTPYHPFISEPLVLCIGTLELKTEKQNAHSDYILSVDFSPDGKTIISGGHDKALKVWEFSDSGMKRLTPHHRFLSEPLVLHIGTLDLKTEKQNAHSGYIRSVDFSPDGKTIISGGNDKALKVWDAGMKRLNPCFPSLPELSCAVYRHSGAQD